MSYAVDVSHSDKKIRVNWANECVIGALLSAAFTAMASNSGMEGVTASSIPARLHDFIILGGMAMGMICGIAAVILILAQIVEAVVRQIHAVTRGELGGKSFANLQFAKFVKIFLP